MASQIIVRGKVVERVFIMARKPHTYYALVDEQGQDWYLDTWARKYLRETIIISLEEKEKEPERDKIINASLELAGA